MFKLAQKATDESAFSRLRALPITLFPLSIPVHLPSRFRPPQAMFKLAQKAAESARVSLRRARKEGMDAIKKAADVIPEDERKRAEKKVEDAVAAAKKQLDAICEAKEKELKG
ncbi:unnamed protein product [Closterium sp. NIES-54]